MQIVLLLGFIIIYLLVLWLGAVAFETTGMERRKARFQALSAMTGTGFTTTEAEAVVNHPARRRIATWLIFIGNAGVVGAIVSIVLYVRAGAVTPPWQFGVLGGVLLLVLLLVLFKVIDRLTGFIVRRWHRGRPGELLFAEALMYEAGDSGLSRLSVKDTGLKKGATLAATGLRTRGVTVLAILRGDELLANPEDEASLQAEDQLFCYGPVREITRL